MASDAQERPEAPSGGAAPESRDPTQTPFGTLGLDPWQTPEELTEVMRELAEDAEDDERRKLQGMWRELTLNQDDQLSAALFAHAHPARSLDDLSSPEARQPKALTRRFPLRAPSRKLPAELTGYSPQAEDLVILPPLMLSHSAARLVALTWPDVDPDDDPLLDL